MNISGKYYIDWSDKTSPKTDTQVEFSKKFKEITGKEVDWSTYTITRGRGWSKADGSCGSSFAVKGGFPICCLYYPLRKYLTKKYEWVIFSYCGDLCIELKKKK